MNTDMQLIKQVANEDNISEVILSTNEVKIYTVVAKMKEILNFLSEVFTLTKAFGNVATQFLQI